MGRLCGGRADWKQLFEGADHVKENQLKATTTNLSMLPPRDRKGKVLAG
jgi:hypothetical protein